MGSIIKGQKTALEVCQWLKPQVILPTAAGGDIEFQGILTKVMSAEGTIDDFRSLLTNNNLTTQVIEPQAGETVALNLHH